MKIFEKLEDIKMNMPTVVALGNFDGVHLGHQKLIRNAVDFAHLEGISSAVFTFSNHPRNLSKTGTVKNIMDFEEKSNFIESLGIDYLFNIPFDDYVRHLSSEEFVQKILVERFNIRQAYCGFNYRFGFRASGNPEKLLHYGIEKGFGLHILEPFTVDGIVVSSTEIRKALQDGDIETVNKFLGRKYSLNGTVICGRKLGRKLGFPTANLAVSAEMALPLSGVYVTKTHIDEKSYRSVSNIGRKPTVGEHNKNLETYIFNFDENIYGKEIKVEFLGFLRSEKHFKNLEDLKSAMETDKKLAISFEE